MVEEKKKKLTTFSVFKIRGDQCLIKFTLSDHITDFTLYLCVSYFGKYTVSVSVLGSFSL